MNNRSKRFEEALAKFTEYKLKMKKELLEGRITDDEYKKLIRKKAEELDL